MGGTTEEAMAYLDAETYFSPEECVGNGVATGYCEYADEDEVDPQEGDQAGEKPEDEQLKALPAGASETDAAKAEDATIQAPLFSEGPKSDEAPESGGDHGNKPRDAEQDDEQAGGDHQKKGKSEEASEGSSGKAPAIEEAASSEEEEGGVESDASASGNRAGERGRKAPCYNRKRATLPYPTWLREEL